MQVQKHRGTSSTLQNNKKIPIHNYERYSFASIAISHDVLQSVSVVSFAFCFKLIFPLYASFQNYYPCAYSGVY